MTSGRRLTQSGRKGSEGKLKLFSCMDYHVYHKFWAKTQEMLKILFGFLFLIQQIKNWGRIKGRVTISANKSAKDFMYYYCCYCYY